MHRPVPEQSGGIDGLLVHVVAFDGVLVDSLPARCTVLRDALLAVDPAMRQAPIDAVADLLPGRTFEEAAVALIPLALQRADPPCVTLCALQAESAWRTRCAHGIALHATVGAQLLAAQARGARIVLRADSARREVEGMLRQAGLDALAALVRCADDGPPRVDPSVAVSATVSATANSTAAQSYRAIAQRLAVWPPIARTTIHEASRYATAIAAATLRA